MILMDTFTFFQALVDIFFTFDHPNKGYSFLHKLEEIDSKAHEILEAGAMCTNKLYARKAVYLCLEQTVIRYAASPMRLLLSEYQKVLARGGVSLSLSVVWHCWSSINLLIFNQGGYSKQLTKCRITGRCDNADMNSVTFTMNQTCNPFSFADLVNISSEKAANEGTKKFLPETLEQERKLRLQFENVC